jgi:hypothetical protein
MKAAMVWDASNGIGRKSVKELIACQLLDEHPRPSNLCPSVHIAV